MVEAEGSKTRESLHLSAARSSCRHALRQRQTEVPASGVVKPLHSTMLPPTRSTACSSLRLPTLRPTSTHPNGLWSIQTLNLRCSPIRVKGLRRGLDGLVWLFTTADQQQVRLCETCCDVLCCAVLFIPFGVIAPALSIFLFVNSSSSNLELFFLLLVAHLFALTGSCPYSDATTTKPLDSLNLLNF
jgi:hypothetical protein